MTRIRLIRDGHPIQPAAMPAATGHWWSGYEDDKERQHRLLMRQYAAEDERVRAANGGRMPSFATTMNLTDGSAIYDEPPPRQVDDPPDPQHSPELVAPTPPAHIPVAPAPRGHVPVGAELPSVGRPDRYPPAEQRIQIAGD
jgi:hypothetical protein